MRVGTMSIHNFISSPKLSASLGLLLVTILELVSLLGSKNQRNLLIPRWEFFLLFNAIPNIKSRYQGFQSKTINNKVENQYNFLDNPLPHFILKNYPQSFFMPQFSR